MHSGSRRLLQYFHSFWLVTNTQKLNYTSICGIRSLNAMTPEMYQLLQSHPSFLIAELLQDIQVSHFGIIFHDSTTNICSNNNHNNYCSDCCDQVVNISQTLGNITVEDVLKTRRDWWQTFIYPQVFNSSPYTNYNTNQCDLHTSLYRMLVMN